MSFSPDVVVTVLSVLAVWAAPLLLAELVAALSEALAPAEDPSVPEVATC